MGANENAIGSPWWGKAIADHQSVETENMADEIVPYGFDFSAARVESGLWSLNYFWGLAGSPEDQRPSDWMSLPEAKKLIAQLCKELNTEKSGILEAKRGKGGGTSAHWKLALEYSGYLSVELRSKYLGWVRDRLEEESNPELAVSRGVDRGIAGWRRQGKTDEWIKQRLSTLGDRHDFTDSLKAHGCSEGFEFATCTNNIYQPLLGGTAKEIKTSKGLSKSAKLRDNLSRVELLAVGLAEAIASERMENESAEGFKDCAKISRDAGSQVSKAFPDRP